MPRTGARGRAAASSAPASLLLLALVALVAATAADASSSARAPSSAPSSSSAPPYTAAALADRVDPALLPGISRSRPLDFPLFAGYIPVDGAATKRALYYVLAESADAPEDPSSLVLWMNGGPGCSSVGGGLLSEQGPFFPRRLLPPTASSSSLDDAAAPARFALDPNPHAWNRGGTNASVVFVESPAYVGFSYSNDTADAVVGDVRTARDAATFLRRFLERFPKYKGVPLYLSGESYAGHYVPTLAAEILRVNEVVKEAAAGKAAGGAAPSSSSAAASAGPAAASAAALPTVPAPAVELPLRGFLLGNAWTDPVVDNGGCLDFWYSHAMISAETRRRVREVCDLGTAGPLMLRAQSLQARKAAGARASAAASAAPPQALFFTRAAAGENSGARVEDEACDDALELASAEAGDINIYSVYKPVCREPGAAYEGMDGEDGEGENGGSAFSGGADNDDDVRRAASSSSPSEPSGARVAEAPSASPSSRPVRSPMAAQPSRGRGGGGFGAARARDALVPSSFRASSGDVSLPVPRRRRYDPCIGDEVEAFLNDPRVQEALHADVRAGSIPGGSRGDVPPPADAAGWSDCTGRIDYSRQDLLSSMLPLYARLMGIPEDAKPSEQLLGPAAAGGLWGGEQGRWAADALEQQSASAAAKAAAAASLSAGANTTDADNSGSSKRGPGEEGDDAAIRAGWLEAAAKSALRMWVYSGDTDGIVPVLGTRRWVEGLGLNITKAWRAWNDAEDQVGGRRVDYGPPAVSAAAVSAAEAAGSASSSSSDAAGAASSSDPRPSLSFVTVRAAGHMVPYDQPMRAQQLLRDYLSEEPRPAEASAAAAVASSAAGAPAAPSSEGSAAAGAAERQV